MSQLYAAIILGVIQGLTEFFPISSSGHLVILPWLFSWKAHPLTFDIILHMGTLCAIVIYFRREWVDILRQGFLSIREKTLKGPIERKLFWYIIIATIPAIICGAIFGVGIEYHFRNPLAVALTLGAFGLILYISDLRGRKNKSLAEITLLAAFLIGLSQMLAIIPGVSRSGITITAALALGMNRESSVRFSFLLAAPVIFGAALYSMGAWIEIGKLLSWPAITAGFIASFLSSILAIHFLLKYIKRHAFTAFAVYRLALSVFVVIIFLWGSVFCFAR